jgi:hypothetical protein
MQLLHACPGATSGNLEYGGTTQPNSGGLTPKASEFLAERDGLLPVWIRAPKNGPDPFTGLTKAKLYQLANSGKIVTRCLRDKGQIRGVRLFSMSSILGYINACPAGVIQEGGAE